MRTFAATLLLLAGLAAPARAVTPFVPGCYQYGVGQYSVAPGFSYSYSYGYPAQKVVAQNIAVAPLVVTVPVDAKAVPVTAYGVPYYYSASEAYRERSAADDKEALRGVVREELQKALAPAPAPSPRPSPSPSPSPAPAPGPGLGPQVPGTGQADAAPAGPDATTPPELQQEVLAAYGGRANCLTCHGAAGKSAFKLVDDDGNLLAQPADKRWKIYGMAATGAMPPTAANDASKAMETNLLPALAKYAAQD